MKIGTVILAGVILLGQISMARSEGRLNGLLVYGWGDSIREVSVTFQGSSQPKIIYASSGEQISGLADLDKDHFLFSEGLRGEIKIFDRSTGRAADFVEGVSPVFVPNQRKLIFYRKGSENRGLELVMADLSDPVQSARILDDGNFPTPLRIVQVGDDLVVFRSSRKHGGTLRAVNVVTGAITDLGGECSPKLWRARTKELICFDPGRGQHFLRNLAGTTERILSAPPGTVMLAYDNDNDVVLVGYEQGREHSVGVYSLNDSPIIPVIKYIIVGEGGAIWRSMLPSL